MHALVRRRLARCAIATASTALVLSATACAPSAADDGFIQQHLAADQVLLAADVGDAYLQAPQNLRPAFPQWQRLPAQWTVEGYLIGDDHPRLRPTSTLARPTMHGVVASRRDAHDQPEYVVALRGTVGMDEWEIDAFALHRAAPWPDSGEVPAGFLALYESLTFLPVAGEVVPGPAALALHDRIGAAPVTLVGHSAGAVLATYLSLDLVLDDTPNRVAGRFFASARPGDSAFGAAFARIVTDYRVFNNVRDLVPRLPPGFGRDGFKPLAQVTGLNPSRIGVGVRDTPGCNHHAVSYAALLDFNRMPLAAWQARFAAAQQPRDCIAASRAKGSL